MKRDDADLHLPADYNPRRDGATAFHFADEDCYPCFPLGSLWNGFDNVSVSPAVRDVIVARWRATEGFDPDTVEDMVAVVPGHDGRICLGWGYATGIGGEIQAG